MNKTTKISHSKWVTYMATSAVLMKQSKIYLKISNHYKTKRKAIMPRIDLLMTQHFEKCYSHTLTLSTNNATFSGKFPRLKSKPLFSSSCFFFCSSVKFLESLYCSSFVSMLPISNISIKEGYETEPIRPVAAGLQYQIGAFLMMTASNNCSWALN